MSWVYLFDLSFDAHQLSFFAYQILVDDYVFSLV